MDLHTLHIEHAALLGCFTLLTFVNSVLHRRMSGVGWFPAFTVSAFAGSLLIALRGTVPVPVSVVAGSFLFSLGYVFLHRSLMEFFGRGRQGWALQLALSALCGGLLWQWAVVAPDTRNRLLGYSLVLAAQLGLTSFAVLWHATGAMRWTGRMMGGLLLLLSVNNLLRAALVLLRGVPHDYLRGGIELGLVLLCTSVFQSAIIIAFVWMTADRLRERLQLEATTDPLTRLLNRRALEERAGREILLSRHQRLPLSAILIDLDDFKTINDVYGHACGDGVLSGVAQCLGSQLRPTDALARLGGDEFVVLLPRTSRHEALGVAEQLRGCLEEFSSDSIPAEVQVRASFGTAELHPGDAAWEQLVVRCDQALYEAKSVGGNCVLVH